MDRMLARTAADHPVLLVGLAALFACNPPPVAQDSSGATSTMSTTEASSGASETAGPATTWIEDSTGPASSSSTGSADGCAPVEPSTPRPEATGLLLRDESALETAAHDLTCVAIGVGMNINPDYPASTHRLELECESRDSTDPLDVDILTDNLALVETFEGLVGEEGLRLAFFRTGGGAWDPGGFHTDAFSLREAGGDLLVFVRVATCFDSHELEECRLDLTPHQLPEAWVSPLGAVVLEDFGCGVRPSSDYPFIPDPNQPLTRQGVRVSTNGDSVIVLDGQAASLQLGSLSYSVVVPGAVRLEFDEEPRSTAWIQVFRGE